MSNPNLKKLASTAKIEENFRKSLELLSSHYLKKISDNADISNSESQVLRNVVDAFVKLNTDARYNGEAKLAGQVGELTDDEIDEIIGLAKTQEPMDTTVNSEFSAEPASSTSIPASANRTKTTYRSRTGARITRIGAPNPGGQDNNDSQDDS